MDTELLGCMDDCGTCIFAWYCPCLLNGKTLEQSRQGSFLEGCCCIGYCAGCHRSSIQEALGVPDSGCCANCCIRICCQPCALTQESRAVRAWIKAGRPQAGQPTLVPGAVAM